MTVSFSKALGAPAGSILLGRKKLISHARVYQKWYGGGLHQSGVLASTCLFALQNNINCISVDHQNAKLLAQLSTQDLDRDIILMNPVETNIVMFNIKELKISVDTFIDMAKDQSILLYRWNDSLVRAVTHKDINRDEIVIAGEIINKIFKSIS
jgi:threonine aldolase